MIFHIEQQGQKLESFEADNHIQALKAFRVKHPIDADHNPVMLRDWQAYRVTEDSILWCIAWNQAANFHNCTKK